jgi:dephospho-CoA kinase
MKKKKWYIGIVGPIASGKEEFANYFIKKYGFGTFSLSTILHMELTKRGVEPVKRKTLQDIGDELRRTYGGDVLAKRAIEILNHDGKSVIITGIRNPAEVDYLNKIKNFILVAVVADDKIRYDRMRRRGKPWDPKTWEDFQIVNKRDLGIGQDKTGQQVGETLKLAHFRFENNGTLALIYKKIEKFIKKFKIF